MSGASWRFLRHYFEMVAAMVLGMVVLGSLSSQLDLPDHTAFKLVEMAVWMTVPMTLWMRIRGHRWRACAEMVAAMLLPAGGALVLFAAGVVTDSGVLLMMEHIAMFPAMLVAMLRRRDEYAGHRHHVGANSVREPDRPLSAQQT